MKKSTLWFLLVLLLLSSCTTQTPLSTPLSDTAQENAQTEVWLSTEVVLSPEITPQPTSTSTVLPTVTQIYLTPTITPTPFPLSNFSTRELRAGVIPATYLEDTCRFLENRWGEGKSQPGTIVVPIMFHSVAQPGRKLSNSYDITMEYFEYFMKTAKEMGFSTITMEELVGFLEENNQIPERTMILILDDRRPGVAELFLPYLEENDWTLTLAWITTDDTSDTIWSQMEQLAETGRYDVQSHGHNHVYIQNYVPLEQIEEEIYRPIEIIQAHFNTTPNSIIWPGGNFTDTAIDMARDAGFKLGFTAYSRGPLMFNWIPLGDPESAVEDPLFVLPRYWSTAADVALEHALKIGESAKQSAAAVKAEELLYYDIYCQSAEGE